MSVVVTDPSQCRERLMTGRGEMKTAEAEAKENAPDATAAPRHHTRGVAATAAPGSEPAGQVRAVVAR